MPSWISRSIAVALLVGGCSCGKEDVPADVTSADAPRGVTLARSSLTRASTPSDVNVPTLAEDSQAFAFALFKEVAREKAGENVVLSPYSIATALAMTYAGARGETERAMAASLRFSLAQPLLHEAFNATERALASRGEGKAGADGTPFRLRVGNALWAQRGVTVVPSYLDTLATHYGAGVYLADFRTNPEGMRGAINAWVEARTEKLIPELLPPGAVDPSTTFVLTNTVYFNASWKTKFEVESTRDEPFTKLDGSTVQVPIMSAELRDLPYARGARYEAVALPYASEELAFLAILPDAGAYAEVEAGLDADELGRLRTLLQPASVRLSLPKLDYKTEASLKSALGALGMGPAFDGADFSGLADAPLEIADVLHEAVIKVIEGGTIAAAATGVVVRVTSAPLLEHTVRLDRPFLYAIVDQPTGQVLFLGRVLDPSK